MQQQIQKKIEILQLQKADKENTIKELYSELKTTPNELKKEFERRKDQMLKECVDVAQLWTDYFINNRKK